MSIIDINPTVAQLVRERLNPNRQGTQSLSQRHRADNVSPRPQRRVVAVGLVVESPRLHHFRSHSGSEVDIVLERPAGSVAGIEVKSTSNPGARDFAGLQALQAEARDRFIRGVLLYGGDQVLPFGADLFAVPIGALWSSHQPTT